MDKKYILKKLKKYLFFISIVFLALTSTSLIYNYIYYDSKEIAQKWGIISESFVWTFPNLNPLKYSNDYNSYINHILYRSLLTYDINKKQIIWDLAKCDIWNLSKIECFLDDNIKWSSWDNIKIDDIVATYNILKETDINPVLRNTLKRVKITARKSSIVFETNGLDVNILNIFFQAILPKDVIEKIDIKNISWNFSPIAWVYSWKYKISKVDQDETVWFTKIFLEKNEFYSRNPVYIDNIILKFYKDYTALLQQKDNINIFGDKKHLIWSSIPKLKKHNYVLPQYVWVFINKDKLEYPNIRNYILSNIDPEKVIKEIWEENNKLVKSPFLNSLNLNTLPNKSTIKAMLNSLWYHKKEYYLRSTKSKTTKKYSKEVSINNKTILEENINITEIKNSITKENYNSDSKIISSPEWIDRYNFITNPNITLEWKTNKNVSEIYINDYKLENYNPSKEKFYFKLSETIGNIKLWENNYKLYFKESGKKSLKETVTIFYNKDKQNLEKLESNLIAKLINNKIKEKKKAIENKKKAIENENIKKTTAKVILGEEEIQKQNLIKELDSKFYYNKNFKPYSINLSYIQWSKEISTTSLLIAKELEKVWIKINLTAEKLIDITKQVWENKEKYDILIAWINLWYFNFNISKYFYSWQISQGRNLSKIKNSDLDNILEDLKSWILVKDKRLELQKAIINILSKEAVFKPLYSPYYSNLVVKNIEWYELNEVIPSDIYRFEPLSKSYILKNKIINYEGKSVVWFIKFLIGSLF
jgi:hypothetical protein